MRTDVTNGVPPDVMADLQAVMDHVARGKPLDPEVVRRVQERAAKIRQEILEKHGVQNIGVQILREMRRVLRPDGPFVFSILHPCFPGMGSLVAADWPPDGGYYHEGWWRTDAEHSDLRRRVKTLQKRLKSKRLDGMLVFDRQNTFYLTGLRCSLSYLLVTPREAVLLVLYVAPHQVVQRAQRVDLHVGQRIDLAGRSD